MCAENKFATHVKRILICLILSEAAGVVKLKSYLFKINLKTSGPIIKEFPKAACLDNFCRFLHSFSSIFQEPINTYTSGFQKLFSDCAEISVFTEAVEKRNFLISEPIE
jgi:hypothetical protein